VGILKTISRDFQQYGINPQRLFASENQNMPKVIANSIPKAGTNLLVRTLYLSGHLYRRFQKTLYSNSLEDLLKQLRRVQCGEMLPAHLHYDVGYQDILDMFGFKKLLMVRDPRDIALSNVHYITHKDKSHPLHDYFKNHLKNDNERLLVSIQGIKSDNIYVPSIAYIFDKYIGSLVSQRFIE